MKSNYVHFTLVLAENHVRLFLKFFFFDGQLSKSGYNMRIFADLEEMSILLETGYRLFTRGSNLEIQIHVIYSIAIATVQILNVTGSRVKRTL